MGNKDQVFFSQQRNPSEKRDNEMRSKGIFVFINQHNVLYYWVQYSSFSFLLKKKNVL